MKTNGQRHRVTFERDEDGWWVAEAVDVGGCYTQAPSLAAARRRIREAMGLYDIPRTVELEETIDLNGLGNDVARVRDNGQAPACEVDRAVLALARAGLCRRDIRELLGLSTRRVLRASSARMAR